MGHYKILNISPIIKLSFFKKYNLSIQLENIGKNIKYRVAFWIIKDLNKTVNLTCKIILSVTPD